MIELVRLRDRRMHMLLLDGRIIAVRTGDAARPGATVIDRLDLTEGEERREGSTLYVGAFGLMTIVSHLWQRPSYRSKQALGARVSKLFPGTMLFGEMIRATCRAGLGLPGVGGDTGYWLAAARRQLAWCPSESTH